VDLGTDRLLCRRTMADESSVQILNSCSVDDGDLVLGSMLVQLQVDPG
jgi:hypothetical protein